MELNSNDLDAAYMRGKRDGREELRQEMIEQFKNRKQTEAKMYGYIEENVSDELPWWLV